MRSRHSILAFGLAAMILAATLAGTATASSVHALDEAEQRWLEAHGPLRYGYEAQYAPFEFNDAQGHPVGINLDFVDAMSRQHGWDVQRIAYPDLDSMLGAMRSGELDLIGGLNRSQEREVFLDFTSAYLNLESAFYALDPAIRPAHVSELADKRVGIISGYSSGAWLQANHQDLETVSAPHVDALLDLLLTGEVDVIFEESATVGYAARERGVTTVLRVPLEAPLQSQQHWVVPEGETVLLGIIEKGLHGIGPAERAEIFSYWTGFDLSVPSTTPFTLSPFARQLLIGAAGLLALAALWLWTLRRQIRRRTRELAGELRRRVAAEEQLKETNAKLEERVALRTEQLHRSNRDLRAFAMTVSHDLRTPLSAILMNVSVLRTRTDDEKAVAALDRSQRVCEQMERVIKETLEHSRVHAPQPMVHTSLDVVAREVVELLEPTIKEVPEPVRVDVSPLPAIFGAHGQLVQLFQNLIGNAIKYRKPGQPCHISLRSGDGDEAFHHVLVEDQGLGFDQAHIDALLQPFARGEHDTVDGYGIGLATCVRIVERHGGKLDATGSPGAGATFKLLFPKSATALDDEMRGATPGKYVDATLRVANAQS